MQTIFPTDIPELQWAEFAADGFSNPVSGMIFREGQTTAGVPLGGIGTGCIDLNGDGRLGRCSIFNSFAPPRQLDVPFLGVNVDDKTYCLTSVGLSDAGSCRRIRYWGHYPIADLEYELDIPLSIGLRAWAPFIHGDAKTSNCPITFFEVRVRNASPSNQRVRLMFTFPGPNRQESHSASYVHSEFKGQTVRGACVEWDGGNYVLGCPSDVELSMGGYVDNNSWCEGMEHLPEIDECDSGSSLSADFNVDANHSVSVTFVLAWYVPRWAGSDAHWYQHAYTERFGHSMEVAEAGVNKHTHWRQRVLAWQQEIYNEGTLPIWLRDQLVNVLHTTTKDSFWASHSIPRQSWYGSCGPFGLTESPRTTPHVCNPSDWYGNLPLVFFFPELMRSLLRGYVHFQLQTGEVPLGIGEGADFCGHPVYQILHPMNSCVQIHLIDRLWQRDLDFEVLQEFYPSAVKALDYMQSLDEDGDGLPELDADPIPNHFYGAWPWYGLSIYVAGFWLAAVKMMERMSEAYGDLETQALCCDWRDRASQAIENNLWNGSAYLLYSQSATGKVSDSILANQLVGQWCAHLHSMASLYPSEHVERSLQTVLDTCGRATGAGLVNATDIHGNVDRSGAPQSNGIFIGECVSTAATMVYEGRVGEGTEVVRQMMEAIVVRNGAGWELPNLLDADGKVIHGNDFYQMMILWALPLALRREGIREMCAGGNFIDRILRSCGDVQ